MNHGRLAFLLLVACGGEVAEGKDASPDGAAVVDTGLTSTPDAATGKDATTTKDASVAPGDYFAWGILGGYDRIVVYKKDTVRDLCFAVRIVMPSAASGGIKLPGGWGFEAAGVSQGAAACGTGPVSPVSTQSQTGIIAFTTTPQNPYPSTLDIDVILTFAGGSPSWVPPSEKLSAMGLPVTLK